MLRFRSRVASAARAASFKRRRVWESTHVLLRQPGIDKISLLCRLCLGNAVQSKVTAVCSRKSSYSERHIWCTTTRDIDTSQVHESYPSRVCTSMGCALYVYLNERYEGRICRQGALSSVMTATFLSSIPSHKTLPQGQQNQVCQPVQQATIVVRQMPEQVGISCERLP